MVVLLDLGLEGRIPQNRACKMREAGLPGKCG